MAFEIRDGANHKRHRLWVVVERLSSMLRFSGCARIIIHALVLDTLIRHFLTYFIYSLCYFSDTTNDDVWKNNFKHQ